MQKEYSFVYLDKTYKVVVRVKKMKSITYRFRNETFYVSCPPLTPYFYIKRGLNRFAPKLVNYDKKHSLDNSKDEAYLFGHKMKVSPAGGIIKFSDGSSLKYLDYEDLDDKLKQIYQDYMIKKTRYYENLMGVDTPYKVKFKHMSSRFGSNSLQTHSISYMDDLYPYKTDILDSLIVHELAHHFVHSHSKAFYDVVYKYCPNYKKDNIKLKKRKFI